MGVYQIQTYEFIIITLFSLAGFIAFINMAVDKVWDYLVNRRERKREEKIKDYMRHKWVFKLKFAHPDNEFSRYAVTSMDKEEVVEFFKDKSYYRNYDITVEELDFITKHDYDKDLFYC